jgi:hypothetical protein
MSRLTAATALIAAWLVGLAPGASAQTRYTGDPSVRGSVASVERVGGYSAVKLRVLLWAAKLGAPVPVSADVTLYRISYWSVTDGKPVLVSGLMSLPQKGLLRGTVLWMHGTTDDRKTSMSAPTLQESVAASAVFAGGGYLLLAPDLVGLGVSKGPQAYLFNPSTVDVTEDFLRAAGQVSGDLGRIWNPNVYIAGFSQGGQATAVIHRALEQNPNPAWRVRAGAGIAGAYDLAGVSLPFALKGHSNQDSVYLTLVTLSYATYYHQPLESVLTAQYADIAHRLFDGDHAAQIEKVMPTDPRALFTPAFLAAFDGGAPHWFIDAARANEAYAWAPRAPFRAYYGDHDVDVPPADAKAFLAEARRRGGDAEAISVGPYDHGASALHAAPMIRAWFDQLSAAP